VNPAYAALELEVGFSGNQQGLSSSQWRSFRHVLEQWRPGTFHHGDCIGSDADAHAIALSLGWCVVLHPPADPKKRAFCEGAFVTLPPRPFLKRNDTIAEVVDVLVATPREVEEVLRSGTWSTVRRARARKKPIILIWPDGTLHFENWTLPTIPQEPEALAAFFNPGHPSHHPF
jgi:hypothetical protein